MDRRAALNPLFATVAASGISAVLGGVALPDVSPYVRFLVIGGGISTVIGFCGLVWMVVFPAKSPPERPPIRSTSILGGVASQIEVGEIDSSADTLADVKGRLSIRRASHNPSRTSRRTSIDRSTSPDAADADDRKD